MQFPEAFFQKFGAVAGEFQREPEFFIRVKFAVPMVEGAERPFELRAGDKVFGNKNARDAFGGVARGECGPADEECRGDAGVFVR